MTQQSTLQWQGSVSFFDATEQRAVALAMADVCRDIAGVLGVEPQLSESATQADLQVLLDPMMPSEAWRIVINENQVSITGGDALGAVYGLYAFSHRCLGVDPMAYWKDLQPSRQQTIKLKPQTIGSQPATFRFRGWFLKDEDFLTDFKIGGGDRFIDYPHYAHVTHVDVIDQVCQTLLRLGGNLVIPASFLDVMNPAEADLVQRCVERGLYISQHHIEPLGVSHFGFENYWKARGEDRTFEYAGDPEAVRQCWQAFAEKWWAMAGEQVIWQLGLRGKGDRPVWDHVEGIDRDNAGQFISQAMAEQWDIIRSVDSREHPPATTTLWAEGAELMAEGSLVMPQAITVVFSDRGLSQRMQNDFEQTVRQFGSTYGAYYHVGFWARGPHMAQGTRPAKVKAEFDRITAKGDTHYAIINTANIREHLLGLESTMACMTHLSAYAPGQHIEQFAGPLLAPLYRDYLEALIDATPDVILQDGDLWEIAQRYAQAIEQGEPVLDGYYRWAFDVENPDVLIGKLKEAGDRFEQIVKRYDAMADQIAEGRRGFFDVNLRMHAVMMQRLCKLVQVMQQAYENRSSMNDVQQIVKSMIEVRQVAEQGKWASWYRGDTKMNLAAFVRRLE